MSRVSTLSPFFVACLAWALVGCSNGADATGSGGEPSDASADSSASGDAADAGDTAPAEDASDGAPVGQCGEFQFANLACAQCVDKSCCAEANACAANPQCAAHAQCVLGCGSRDSACSQACFAQFPDPTGIGGVFLACESVHCDDACSTGGKCGAVILNTDCNPCAQEKCCDRLQGATASAEFWMFNHCMGDCPSGDQACYQTCVSAHTEGAAYGQWMSHCLDTQCKDSCAPPGLHCGAFSFVPSACNTCATQKCCDQLITTGDSLDYWKESTCLSACPASDSACQEACFKAHPEGYAYGLWQTSCLEIECNQQCPVAGPPGTTPKPCGTSETDGVCGTCQEQHCCDALKQSGTDLEANMYIACRLTCAFDDNACLRACLASHPQGGAKFWLTIDCTSTYCPTDCSAYFSSPPWPCSGWFNSDPVCTDCLMAKCKDPFTTACNTLDFQNYRVCAGFVCPLSDQACLDKCMKDNADGYAESQTATSCMGTMCATECQVTPAPTCGYDFSTSACRDCVQQNCCAESSACASDFDCQKYDACLLSKSCGTDQTCIDGCKAHAPNGVAKSEANSGCRKNKCATPCGL